MDNEQGVGQEQNLSEVIFSWRHKEYIKYHKGIWWYVISLIVLGLLGWYSIAQGNPLFLIFLVIFYLLIVYLNFKEPLEIEFFITPDGIKSGPNFFSYRDIGKFYIIYKNIGPKCLYFEFKNPLRGRLIVPLDDQDAVKIREYLLNFLNEDLEREHEPFSEQLRRWLKL